MIVQEHIEIGGRDFIRTYSDSGRYLVGGVPYSDKYIDACDPAELGRTYTEGDIIPDDQTIEDKAEAYDILMGVDE